MNKYKALISLFLLVLIVFLSSNISFASDGSFTDVDKNHWAYEPVNKLRELNITDGIGNGEFGMGQTITKNEFVTFLVKLMKWDLVSPEKGSFNDNLDSTKWYYSPVETALEKGVIVKESDTFNGNAPITREEIAVMVIRTLDYDMLANKFSNVESPFSDVTSNKGYIMMAKDFGIVSGVGNNKFNPKETAKREEAAAMMIRMYDKMNSSMEEINAFYAISSANQSNLIKDLDTVSFGWSRLEYDKSQDKMILNTSRSNNNEYAYPTGSDEPILNAKANSADTNLMVLASNNWIVEKNNKKVPMVEYILSSKENRKEVIDSIIENLNKKTDSKETYFNGVVIDFEDLRGSKIKADFNVFLKELKIELDKNNKSLYVAVHPKLANNKASFDGYDFKTIGEIADKVILMAHDYYAKSLNEGEMNSGYTTTPVTPIDEIYYSLKYITDDNIGVKDRSKIMVQFSFDSVQWKLKDGKVINKEPYHPTYEMINNRLKQDGVEINYSKNLENPYATFINSEDNTKNIIWYEDSRSIEAKIDMMKLFDIKGISIWRLGNVPNYTENSKAHLDVWNTIKNNMK